MDHARESHFNRDVQLRELQLQEELRRTKAVMVCNPIAIPPILAPDSVLGAFTGVSRSNSALMSAFAFPRSKLIELV